MPIERRSPTAVAALWTEWVQAAACYDAPAIRLEDLSRAETRCSVLRRLFDALGLALTPEVERFAATLPWVNAEKHTLERWKNDLDAKTLAEITRVRGFTECLSAHGYVV